MAPAFLPGPFTEHDVRQWPFWDSFPIGPQRDACEALELCLDPESMLHSACGSGECYGALLHKLTSFQVQRNLLCNHCPYEGEQTHTQCFLRVTPAANTETSICQYLQEADVPGFTCESCGGTGARQQTALGDLPPFLVVHVNKQAGVATGISAEARVRVSGVDLERMAAVHHVGATADSGHYTATVTTSQMAYHCNDRVVNAKRELHVNAWDNTYLIFLRHAGSPTFEVNIAKDKERRARKLAVIADTTIVEDREGVRQTVRQRVY